MIRCRLCKEIYAVLTVEKDGECSEVCLICAKKMKNTYPLFSILRKKKSKENISSVAIKSEIKLRKELEDLKIKYPKNNT